MRKIKIISKAIYLYTSGFVTLSSDKGKFLWFDVYDDEDELTIKVKVGYDGRGYLVFDCDCKNCGIKSKYNPLCSYKFAVVFWLEHEHMRKIWRK